jgi:protein-S-isoprenylcysteine O-methyltransferase Ste14
MKRHPIFAGCLIMMGAMLALLGSCVMGILTNPFVK